MDISRITKVFEWEEEEENMMISWEEWYNILPDSACFVSVSCTSMFLFSFHQPYDSLRIRRSIQLDGYYSSHHEISHSGRIPIVKDHVVVYNYDPTLGMTRIYPVNSNGSPQFGASSSNGLNAWNTNGLTNSLTALQNGLPNSVQGVSGGGSSQDSSISSGGGSNSLSDIASLVQRIPGASAIPGFNTIQSLASLTNLTSSRSYSLLSVASFILLIINR